MHEPVLASSRALARPRWLLRRARIAAVARRVEPDLLWIFGSPRSGSTWLLDLLGAHERVVPINEPLIGMFFSPFLLDLPGWDPGALDSENFTLRKVQADQPDQFLAREFEPTWLPDLGRLMRRRFAAHAVRYPTTAKARPVIAIKEPNGSESADLIMRALPRSRLLFLLRDGRDVVDSELAANLKGSWVSKRFPGGLGVDDEHGRVDFVARSARKWLWRTQMVEEAYAAHPGPKKLIRYETLRAQPVETMKEIFDWLDLPILAPDLNEMVGTRLFEKLPQEMRGRDKFHRAAQPGLWRENLSPPEQSVARDVMGAKLDALGYTAS